MSNLQPVPDPLTIEALAITPLVEAHSLLTGFTYVLSNGMETSLQSSAMESVSWAYQSAWSYLVVELSGLGPENQMSVVFAIPASCPTILQWRSTFGLVYIWGACYVALLLPIGRVITNIHGFQTKEAPAIECQTYSWLVSPGLGPEKKKGRASQIAFGMTVECCTDS